MKRSIRLFTLHLFFLTPVFAQWQSIGNINIRVQDAPGWNVIEAAV
jgi:hypothetical protein